MKTIIALLVFVSVLACKADGPRTLAATVDSAGPRVSLSEPPERKIVRRAALRIVVADTGKAVNDVTASVEAFDGYVSDSEVWREGELLRARLTLRVPSKSLSPALAAIRKVARRVENETMSSEDVTQESVDLAARLRNLEATEVELRKLLETVRQNARKAADILEVHHQLMEIRGEIEQTKARIQHLGTNVAMSSIGLEVIPDAITKPVVEATWHPGVIVKDATRALVSAARAFAAAAIWIVIYVIPICGTFALGMAAAWTAARVFRRRSRPPAP